MSKKCMTPPCFTAPCFETALWANCLPAPSTMDQMEGAFPPTRTDGPTEHACLSADPVSLLCTGISRSCTSAG
jgi:hypothetical protein